MVYYNSYYVQASGISDLNECELKYLRKMVLSGCFDFYIEVGVGCMGTLCSIAQNILQYDNICHCIGIDCFGKLPKDRHGNNTHQGDVIKIEDAKKILQNKGIEHIVTLYKGDSSILLKKVLKDIHYSKKIIFIDANHSYKGCLSDFESVDEFVVHKDKIVFHDTLEFQHQDYGRGPRGVVEDYLLRNKKYRLIYIPPQGDTLNNEVNTMSVFEVF